ncbi:MAG: T9SS type A sorting domain-containing protein [Bacteroidia bacterium]|nr:T9SS type A sorting domain-containing protein [Bacteroidia bacterium]
MRKFFASIVFIAAAGSAWAQKTAGQIGISGQPIQRNDKAVLDTVFNGFENYTPVVYTVPDDTGGYVSGSNGYGDQAKVQEFLPAASCFLTDVIYWFGTKVKNTGGDTSSVILNYYRKDSIQLVNGAGAFVPGTIVVSDTVKLSDIPIDADFDLGMYVWNLPGPEFIDVRHCLGFDMSLMNNRDSIAIYTSTDGQTLTADRSWEKWQNKWNTIDNAWGLNIDLAIFPVYDIANASLEEANSLPFHIYPNPTTDRITVHADFMLASMRVMDLNGKTLLVQKGAQNSLNVAQLAEGIYILNLESTAGARHFVRFVVKH